MTRAQRAQRRIRSLPTWALRFLDESYSRLPAFVMAEHRAAIKLELLARELHHLADESGGYPVAPVPGTQ